MKSWTNSNFIFFSLSKDPFHPPECWRETLRSNRQTAHHTLPSRAQNPFISPHECYLAHIWDRLRGPPAAIWPVPHIPNLPPPPLIGSACWQPGAKPDSRALISHVLSSTISTDWGNAAAETASLIRNQLAPQILGHSSSSSRKWSLSDVSFIWFPVRTGICALPLPCSHFDASSLEVIRRQVEGLLIWPDLHAAGRDRWLRPQFSFTVICHYINHTFRKHGILLRWESFSAK